ncbi:hypothetical protein ACWD5R_32045 [Streptomyces sp. NPDC002514]|uniref:hypothetical protein n=1 Tax=Streptomyces sp. NPDC001270 TaxID=3364554 RepID=UPI0036A5BE61
MLDGLPDFPGFPGTTPDPVKGWALYDDGTLGSLTLFGCGLPELPRPGKLITKQEYDRIHAEMMDAHAARLQEMEAVDAARQEREYRHLTEAGIPETTARSLSGYTGPTAPAARSYLGASGLRAVHATAQDDARPREPTPERLSPLLPAVVRGLITHVAGWRTRYTARPDLDENG